MVLSEAADPLQAPNAGIQEEALMTSGLTASGGQVEFADGFMYSGTRSGAT